MTGHVLKRGSADVERAVEDNIDDAVGVMPTLFDAGVEAAMKALHTKKKD